MGRFISPMRERTVPRSDPRIAPGFIVPMSFRLVIPWRVALQQSSPPLHQPWRMLQQRVEGGQVAGNVHSHASVLTLKMAVTQIAARKINTSCFLTFV